MYPSMQAPIVEGKDIPKIDLYMDQVTTFMEDALADGKRNPEDKILTKTMINNYAKARLFPPPVKKKYSRNHIMLLIMIYHLKTVLSISDIGLILRPITEKLTKKPESSVLEKIYQGFTTLQNNEGEPDPNFESEEEAVRRILSVLSYTVQANAKKRAAESIIDTHFTPEPKGQPAASSAKA